MDSSGHLSPRRPDAHGNHGAPTSRATRRRPGAATFVQTLARSATVSLETPSTDVPRPVDPAQGDAARRWETSAPRDAASEAARDAPFSPPPAVLLPPLPPSIPTEVGSAFDRASLAALADRLLQSIAVGRVGRAGHEVRLRLRAIDGEDALEVCLRTDGTRLSATLRGGPGTRARADALVERLERELGRRGMHLESLEVQILDGTARTR